MWNYVGINSLEAYEQMARYIFLLLETEIVMFINDFDKVSIKGFTEFRVCETSS